MKRILIVSVGLLLGSFSANASYTVEGSASHLTSGGGGYIGWECPPPNIKCFTHSGTSTVPSPGDKITLILGPNSYTVILESVNSGGSDSGGRFTGRLLDPTDWDEIALEME